MIDVPCVWRSDPQRFRDFIIGSEAENEMSLAWRMLETCQQTFFLLYVLQALAAIFVKRLRMAKKKKRSSVVGKQELTTRHARDHDQVL